jgi:hypothetical protein
MRHGLRHTETQHSQTKVTLDPMLGTAQTMSEREQTETERERERERERCAVG